MVTLIMAYFNNPGMLAIQIADWCALPEEMQERIRIIVVDDCSENSDWELFSEMQSDFTRGLIQVYRLKEKVRWNQDACRNIGAKHCETSWMLMTDIDHRVPQATWEYVLEHTSKGHLKSSRAYNFMRVEVDGSPYKPHPNSWLLHRWLFEAVGGYDERLAGHYGTDGDFKVRLLAQADKHVVLPVPLIRVGRETVPDASTPREYGRKTQHDKDTIQQILMQRLRDGNPPPIRYRFPYERVL